VSLRSSVESHARFADNRVTTSGRSEDLEITTTVWVGRRRGSTIGNDPAADALKRVADEAVEIARVSPVHRCRSRIVVRPRPTGMLDAILISVAALEGSDPSGVWITFAIRLPWTRVRSNPGRDHRDAPRCRW
jgi:hypothetical protein